MTEALDSSVEITVAAANVLVKEATIKPTQPMVTGGPSAVTVEVPTDVAVEPLEERTKTASSSFLSLKQTRSVGSEDVPQPESGKEVAKELTLSEAILKQIVAEVGVW